MNHREGQEPDRTDYFLLGIAQCGGILGLVGCLMITAEIVNVIRGDFDTTRWSPFVTLPIWYAAAQIVFRGMLRTARRKGDRRNFLFII